MRCTLILLIGLTIFAGCRAAQLGSDQRDMRGTLLALYENQLIDNLVRARKGLPFVHIDYGKIVGSIKHTGTAGFEFSGTNTTNSLTAGGAGITGVDSQVVKPSVGGQQINDLTLTGEPVLQNDAVYEAYAEYAARPDFLMGPQKKLPPDKDAEGVLNPDGALLAQESSDGYYWIPRKQADGLRDLFLATTVMRQAKVIQTKTLRTKIVSLVLTAPTTQSTTAPTSQPGKYLVILRLADQVRNQPGILRVPIGGAETVFDFEPAPFIDEGDLTNRVVLVVNSSQFPDVKALALLLEDKPAILAPKAKPVSGKSPIPTQFLFPQPSTTQDDIRLQLELLRLQRLGD